MVDRKTTFPIINDFSHVDTHWDTDNFLEKRNAYDANDNIEYQGWAQPGAGAGELKWHIVKHTFVAGNVSGFNLTHTRQASDQVKFDKSWNDRSTYFV